MAQAEKWLCQIALCHGVTTLAAGNRDKGSESDTAGAMRKKKKENTAEQQINSLLV